MSSIRVAANKLYKFKAPDLLSTDGAKLPEAYKNFYKEWKLTRPAPVHYVPPQSKWIRDEETGEVKRVADIPIPVKYVPESHKGIWGGEGVIKGFQKRDPQKTRVPHYWVPNLKKSAVYSEILNKRMEVTVTERTIDLILENYGFDNYILKTKACDLQSHLAVKLKRRMLQALHHKTLYPDDPVKREEVFNKYKHFLEPYSAEDIEWYGLNFHEALAHYDKIQAKNNKPVPMKHGLRLLYIQKLVNKQSEETEEDVPSTASSSWVNKLNPFSKK
uniref:Large ribosomal subunit protein bL28m n=1 Tax=Lygus hesperus TaxID=30085 RepID=A0A0A9Z1Q8_LYGHE